MHNKNITQATAFYQNKFEVINPLNISIDLENAKDGDTFILKGNKLIPVSPDLANNDKVAVSPTDPNPDYLYKKFDENFELDKTNHKIKLKNHNHSWNEIDKNGSSINDFDDVDLHKKLENTYLKIENGKIINKPIKVTETNKVKINSEDKAGYLEDKIGSGLTIANNRIAISENVLRKDLLNFPYKRFFSKLEQYSERLKLNAHTIDNKPINYYTNPKNIKIYNKNLLEKINEIDKKLDNIYYVQKFNKEDFFQSDLLYEFNKNELKGTSGFKFNVYMDLNKINKIKLNFVFKEIKKLFNFKEKEVNFSIYIKQNDFFVFDNYKNRSIFTKEELIRNNMESGLFEIHITKTDNYKDILIENIFIEFFYKEI